MGKNLKIEMAQTMCVSMLIPAFKSHALA